MHVLHIPISIRTGHKPTSGIYIERLAEAQKNYNEFDSIGLLGANIVTIERFGRELLINRNIPLPQVKYEQSIVGNKVTLGGYSKRHGSGAIQFAKQLLDLFDDYTDEYGCPNIIHATSGRGAGLAAAFIKISYDIPYVVAEFHPDFNKNNLSRDISQLEFVYSNASEIFVASTGLKQSIDDNFDIEPKTFPNPLAPHFIGVDTRKYDNRTDLLSVGRFDDNRNQDLKIRAMRILKDEFDFKGKLNLIGWGEKQPELIQLINDLKLEDDVNILGYIPQESMRGYYNKSLATLVCSNHETLPTPMIEALGCGCPVISSKTSGAFEISEHVNTGVVFTDRNPRAIANQVMKVKNDKYDRDSIRNQALSRYSPKSVADYSYKIYSKIL